MKDCQERQSRMEDIEELVEVSGDRKVWTVW